MYYVGEYSDSASKGVNTRMWSIYILVTICMIVGTVYSVLIMRRQQHKELDKTLHPTTAKHQLIANPMLLIYLLIPLTFLVVVLFNILK
jgi:hypothetical protein